PLAVVVGSALSKTYSNPPQGVPDAAGFVDMIREALSSDPEATATLEKCIAGAANAERYQIATELFESYTGGIDALVRKAVLRSRNPKSKNELQESSDGDWEDWHIPQGTLALAHLLKNKTIRGPV